MLLLKKTKLIDTILFQNTSTITTKNRRESKSFVRNAPHKAVSILRKPENWGLFTESPPINSKGDHETSRNLPINIIKSRVISGKRNRNDLSIHCRTPPNKSHDNTDQFDHFASPLNN